MSKFRVTADDGTPFFGGQDEIRALPEEYYKQITAQIEQHKAGKPVEAVKIPRHILEKSGFLDNETAKAVVAAENGISPTPEPVRMPQRTASPEFDLESRLARLEVALEETIKLAESNNGPNCAQCPFKEAAMKLIQKTVEKI